jgi:DNA-binding response OmpR family regulator
MAQSQAQAPARMKILLADDQPAALRVLTKTLESSSYDVVTATSGDAALATLLSAQAPQLAVLDWTMPGCDGPAICRRIRAARPRTAYYFILVTAHSDAKMVVSGLEAGADDFITKPYEPDVLLARLRVGARTIRLHEEASRTASYLSTIMAHVDSGMVLTDAAGRVVFANDRLATLSRLGKELKEHDRDSLCTTFVKRALDPGAAREEFARETPVTDTGHQREL